MSYGMQSSHAIATDLIDGAPPLIIWLTLNALSTFVLLRDLRRLNPQTVGLMRWVWILTVLYSGPIGLAVYYYSGRRQIPDDNIWRRSFRSVAHCYSGCGAGEIAGLIVTAGLLGLGTVWVSLGTFAFAYVMGFAMTIGPLIADGEPFWKAIKDSFIAETVSITIMEVTAIGVDIWLAGDATIGEPRFWLSMLISLTLGLFAAYPANVAMIKARIKSGMGHPGGSHHHGH